MKSLIAIAMLLSLASLLPAQAAICLRTDTIDGSDSKDGKLLTLRLKDGKVWQARLQPACPGLRFGGFAWIVRGGQICEGEQILRVLGSGEVCGIGKLTESSAGN